MRGDDPRVFAQYAPAHGGGRGVEYLWSGEAYNADAVSTLGFLAAVTERAQIGPASCRCTRARRPCSP
jgi:alkanesulfonate monooxygenase SsuD/methylene tetrahydromethanopterin reductase-like flavin-dependent oxidoreductase (luciferase family)